MNVHQRIKDFRESREMTYQQFGDAVGVSRGAVQQWEKGKTAPTRKNQPAVAKFMGLTVVGLMQDDSPAKSPSNVIQSPVNIDKVATEGIATLEQITEALAGYLMQMDDDARDDAGDALRKLAHKPENHSRTAAMLATAFHSGKRKRA